MVGRRPASPVPNKQIHLWAPRMKLSLENESGTGNRHTAPAVQFIGVTAGTTRRPASSHHCRTHCVTVPASSFPSLSRVSTPTPRAISRRFCAFLEAPLSSASLTAAAQSPSSYAERASSTPVPSWSSRARRPCSSMKSGRETGKYSVGQNGISNWKKRMYHRRMVCTHQHTRTQSHSPRLIMIN